MQKIGVISGKRIQFLIQDILEPHYDSIMSELAQTGMSEEEKEKYIVGLFTNIYKEVNQANVEEPEQLEELAISMINRDLERVLLPYYMKACMSGSTDAGLARTKQQLISRIIRQETEIPITPTPAPIPMPEPETPTQQSVPQEQPILQPESQPQPVSIPQEPEMEYIEVERPVRRMVEPQIHKKRINWLLVILFSILLTIIVWTVLGLLMSNDIIPRYNMGYTWFNSHIWNLFN